MRKGKHDGIALKRERSNVRVMVSSTLKSLNSFILNQGQPNHQDKGSPKFKQ